MNTNPTALGSASPEQLDAPSNLWGIERVAAFLGCTDRHVHNLCRAGLPHLYVGRLLRFDPVEVRAYLLKHRRVKAA